MFRQVVNRPIQIQVWLMSPEITELNDQSIWGHGYFKSNEVKMKRILSISLDYIYLNKHKLISSLPHLAGRDQNAMLLSNKSQLKWKLRESNEIRSRFDPIAKWCHHRKHKSKCCRRGRMLSVVRVNCIWDVTAWPDVIGLDRVYRCPKWIFFHFDCPAPCTSNKRPMQNEWTKSHSLCIRNDVSRLSMSRYVGGCCPANDPVSNRRLSFRKTANWRECFDFRM